MNRRLPSFRPGASEAGGAGDLLQGFTDEGSELRAALGGKGAGLHLLCALGFQVPAGFTIPADCCRSFLERGGLLDEDWRAAIAGAIQRLESASGKGLRAARDPLVLAVRSGAATSMPGMMDTVLGVRSVADVVRAVEQVFRSFMSRRAVAYRLEKGIFGLRGTAANVQVVCPAEKAGVAFSIDPGRGEPGVLIEAVPGLGDKLVSGDATPERYRVAREGLTVLEARAGAPPLLTRDEAARIAAAALDLERRLGFPVDIEWAIAGGDVHLLQVREIKSADRAAAARDLLRREAARVRGLDRAPGKRALLARYNLDETLSHPSPLAWDLAAEFFGGGGGFLGLYEDLGFRPSRLVRREGFLVLACGRVFAEIDRAAQVFYGTELLRHDPDAVREDPAVVTQPPQLWDRRAATPLAAASTLVRVLRANRAVGRLRREFPERFTRRILPAYLEWCERRRGEPLEQLSAAELLDEAERRIDEVFDGFARQALKMSFFAGLALAELEDLLHRALGEEEGGASVRLVISGLEGSVALAERTLLLAVGRGEAPIARFLERHGHRAAGEMDIACPRWREDPEAALSLAKTLAAGVGAGGEERIEGLRRSVLAERTRVSARFRQLGGEAAERRFEALLAAARSLLPWREDWKGHWMLGFDLIRRAFLELDRRLGLDGCVFQFTRAELRELIAGGGSTSKRHRDLARRRREEDRTARPIVLPDLLTAEELERLASESGAARQPDVPGSPTADTLRGTPIAPGRAADRAWLCKDPAATPPSHPYVLVCASPDTGWTPLLCAARALIVERGGVLSHGALVARELGVPAVVLPRALATIEDGRPVRVDGTLGIVELTADLDRDDRGAPAGESPAPPAATGLGPEPYVPPARPGLGARTALELAAAIAASLLIFILPGVRSLFLPLVVPVFDWTIAGSLSPFWAIAAAAGIAAGAGTLLQCLAADRRRLRGLRTQLSWYRVQSRAFAGTAGRGLAVLERRRRQASAERTLELLRPAALSFLPFCLAFIWVEDRFRGEPIRPGTMFTVEGHFLPGASRPLSRYARLDWGEGLASLAEPRQKIEPDLAGAGTAPYRALWTVEAVKPGKAWVAVTTRGERVEREVLVTEDRKFASERASRTAAPPGADREIAGIDVRLEPVRVALPAPAHAAVDGVVKLFRNGQGVTAEQTAWGPLTTYLVSALVTALVLQRLAGLR